MVWQLPGRGTFAGGQFADLGSRDPTGTSWFGRQDYQNILSSAGAGFNRQRLMDARGALQAFRLSPPANTQFGTAANLLIRGAGAPYGGTGAFTEHDYRHALATGQTHRQVRDFLQRNPSRLGTSPILSTVQSNVDRVTAAQQQSAMSDIAAQRDQFSSQAAALERNLGTTTSQLNTAQTNLADVTGQLDLATSQLGTTRGNLSSTQRALTTSQQQRDALRTQLRGALDASTRITRAAPQRVSGATSATGIAAPRATRSGGFRGTLAGLTRSAPATGPNQLRINTLNI